MARSPLALEYLTFRGLAAGEFAVLAAESSFDAVGLRLHPADRDEPAPELHPGSPGLRALVSLVRVLGLAVLDIEVIPLASDTDVRALQPLLEAGALLGAQFLNVVADDPDPVRLGDTLAELSALAQPYGLRPALEPMAWKTVSRLADAATIAAGAHALVQLDALHMHRAGDDAAIVAGIDPARWSYLQLSDAPAEPPSESPAGLREEGRTARLTPGAGSLPLRELMGVLPSTLPIAIEVPSIARRAELGDRAYAAELRRDAEAFLA